MFKTELKSTRKSLSHTTHTVFQHLIFNIHLKYSKNDSFEEALTLMPTFDI